MSKINKLSIKDIPIEGHRILVRVDFNVPISENSSILDDTRIKASLPTIKHIISNKGIAILMSHLGRPKGLQKSLSLKPCAIHLSKLLNVPVKMSNDCISQDTEKLIREAQNGDVILLENLRFHDGEELPEKYPSFALELSKFGDYYVNDAFGTAHRSHSSTTTITRYFDNKSAMGFLMEKEIEFIGNKILFPMRPFYAIIGGSKVSSKLAIIKSLIKKVDGLFIGGGMAFTFLKALGYSIGASICENDLIDTANEILLECKEKNIKFVLPSDIVIGDAFNNNANLRMIDIKDGIPEKYIGMSIGPQSIEDFKVMIKDAKTILWNGPVGVFEFPRFAQATYDIANILANTQAITIVGGGDSLSAIETSRVGNQITHLSTGGGATLEYIENGCLPGIDVLSDKV